MEYQLLKDQIKQGFPQNKHDLSELLHPYWNVRENLLISDGGFVLEGTRLFIPHELRQSILSDLHASHRGIEGTKAKARLIMYWPGMDNDITNKCRSCSKCKFDRPSNIKEHLQHLPVAEYPFRLFQLIGST